MSDAKSPGTRGPYQNGIRRRLQIIDAAIGVFAQHGYAHASLREIARRVDVTPAALLRHFDSKEDLLLAVLDQWDKDAEAAATPVTGQAPLEYFQGLVDTMRGHHVRPGLVELFLTLCVEASAPTHPAHTWIAERYRHVFGTGAHALRLARARGDIEPLSDDQIDSESRALFAVMDGLELQWLTNPSIDLAAAFAHYLHQALARWKADAPTSPLRTA